MGLALSTPGLVSFSFRIEESFIGEILDCEGRSYVCKIYVDSYRQILNEKTDEVDASIKRFATFIIIKRSLEKWQST